MKKVAWMISLLLLCFAFPFPSSEATAAPAKLKGYELDMKNMSVTGEINRKALQAVLESLPEMNIVREVPPPERVYTDKFTPVKY